MDEAFVAALTICILAVMSIRANGRFKDEDRLPIQWSLDNSVNWTSPRPVALAFTPVSAAIVLSLMAVLRMSGGLKPKPGQEGLEVPTWLFTALVFIGAHALHLWLITRSLRRKS